MSSWSGYASIWQGVMSNHFLSGKTLKSLQKGQNAVFLIKKEEGEARQQ